MRSFLGFQNLLKIEIIKKILIFNMKYSDSLKYMISPYIILAILWVPMS